MGKAIVIASVLASALFAGGASAGQPQVEQGLSFLVGEWTIDGFQDRYRDSCGWFDDHAFVICNTMDGRHGTPQHHVAVLGWSAATGNYTYLSYGEDGSSRSETCFANAEKGNTCLGERRADDGFTQLRTSIWPTPTGLGIRQERSLNAAAWKDVGQVQYIRAK
jgi:hypothetical protein